MLLPPHSRCPPLQSLTGASAQTPAPTEQGHSRKAWDPWAAASSQLEADIFQRVCIWTYQLPCSCSLIHAVWLSSELGCCIQHRLAILLGSKATFRNHIKPDYESPGFFMFPFSFPGRVSCNPGWPWTHYVTRITLTSDLPTSSSQVLGLQACGHCDRFPVLCRGPGPAPRAH